MRRGRERESLPREGLYHVGKCDAKTAASLPAEITDKE
jgi:hypothetical protein